MYKRYVVAESHHTTISTVLFSGWFSYVHIHINYYYRSGPLYHRIIYTITHVSFWLWVAHLKISICWIQKIHLYSLYGVCLWVPNLLGGIMFVFLIHFGARRNELYTVVSNRRQGARALNNKRSLLAASIWLCVSSANLHFTCTLYCGLWRSEWKENVHFLCLWLRAHCQMASRGVYLTVQLFFSTRMKSIAKLGSNALIDALWVKWW